MGYVKERHIKLYQKGVETIKEDLGREVIFVMPASKIPCPNCRYDYVNDCSSGIYEPDSPYPPGPQGQHLLIGPQPFINTFCPVCDNSGKILDRTNTRDVLCLIEWMSSEEKQKLFAGYRIFADAELRSVPIEEYDYAINADYFLVDGEKMILAKSPTKEGLRDIIKFSFYVKRDSNTREDSIEIGNI